MKVRDYEKWIENEDDLPIHKEKIGKNIKKMKRDEKREVFGKERIKK